MSNADFQMDRVGSVTVVKLGADLGPLEAAHVERVSDFLLDLTTAEQIERLVIDLSETAFFGSPLVTALFRIHARLSKHGGKLALCAVRPECREMLAITRVDTLWPIYETRDDAVAALGVEPAP